MVKLLGLRKCFEFLFPTEQEEKKEREESAKRLGAVPGKEPERNLPEWGGAGRGAGQKLWDANAEV